VAAIFVQLCRTGPVAGRQVHDANIDAKMLAQGETRLMTMNRSDFRRFEPGIELAELKAQPR
jgi:hypothetical protein